MRKNKSICTYPLFGIWTCKAVRIYLSLCLGAYACVCLRAFTRMGVWDDVGLLLTLYYNFDSAWETPVAFISTVEPKNIGSPCPAMIDPKVLTTRSINNMSCSTCSFRSTTCFSRMTRARKPPSSRTLDWHSAGWKAEKSLRLLKKKTSNVSVKSSSQLLFRTLSNASRKRRTPNCSRQVKKKI